MSNLRKRAEDWTEELTASEKEAIWAEVLEKHSDLVANVTAYHAAKSTLSFDELYGEALLGAFQMVAGGEDDNAIHRRLLRETRRHRNFLELNGPTHRADLPDHAGSEDRTEEIENLMDVDFLMEGVRDYVGELPNKAFMRLLVGPQRNHRWAEKQKLIRVVKARWNRRNKR